ncbi:MAG: hypothetical protein U0559_05085 [Anaerolineae bacterium]
MARTLIVRTNPFYTPLSEAVDRLFNDAWVSPQSRDWATVCVGSRLPVNIYADAGATPWRLCPASRRTS